MSARDGSTPPRQFAVPYSLFTRASFVARFGNRRFAGNDKLKLSDIFMQKLSHQILSFRDFTLDLRRGRLQQNGDVVKLRPKSFEVLKYLVENNGRLISKDELIHAVWVETAVTDDSLVQCMKDIRHALGDEKQQIIKTVHGRGYIFDAEVRDNGSAQVTNNTEETQGVQVIMQQETDE